MRQAMGARPEQAPHMLANPPGNVDRYNFRGQILHVARDTRLRTLTVFRWSSIR